MKSTLHHATMWIYRECTLDIMSHALKALNELETDTYMWSKGYSRPNAKTPYPIRLLFTWHPHSNIHFVIGQLLSVLWLLNGPTATPLLPSLRTAGCNQAFWRHHAEVSGPQDLSKKFPPAEGTEWGRRFPIILPTLVLYFLTIVQSLYFSQSFERFSRRAVGEVGWVGGGRGKWVGGGWVVYEGREGDVES